MVASARGEAVRWAPLFGAAEGLLEVVGATVYNYDQPDHSLYERTISTTRSRLGVNEELPDSTPERRLVHSLQ